MKLLSDVLAATPGREPIPPFVAWSGGCPVVVLALLERTVVYESADERWARREIARPDQLHVQAADLRWINRKVTARQDGRSRRLTDAEVAAL